MTSPDYAARAAAGAAFLDERIPGWAARISLDLLDMSNCEWCILGQLGGCYDEAVSDFDLDDEDETGLGFMRPAGESGFAWELLRNAWTAEIATRREPAQVTP